MSKESIEEMISRIDKMYKKAKQYAAQDPEVCLGLARKTAEAICKQIYIIEGMEKGSKPAEKLMLNDLIGALNKEQKLPKKVVISLGTIQAFGNFGSHDQGKETLEVSSDDIRPCITALTTVTNWYLEEYHANQVPTSSETVPSNSTPSQIPVPKQTKPQITQERKSSVGLIGFIIAIIIIVGGWMTYQNSQKAQETEERNSLIVQLQSTINKMDIPKPPDVCVPKSVEILRNATEITQSISEGHPNRKSGVDEKAVSALHELIKKDNSNGVLWAILATSQLYAGLDSSDLIASAKNAERSCSNWAYVPNLIGNVYFTSKDYDKALDAYQKALSIDKNYASPRFNVAMIMLSKNDYAQTIANIDVLLATHPNHKNAHLIRSQANMQQNKLDDAFSDIGKAIVQDGKNGKLFLVRGTIQSKLGKSEDAMKDFCTAKSLGESKAEKLCAN